MATSLEFPRAWRAVIFVPGRQLSTRQARRILPRRVARADAVFNLARTAIFVAAVLKKDGTLLRLAMHDRLHEPARLRLVPALDFIARYKTRQNLPVCLHRQAIHVIVCPWVECAVRDAIRI